MPEPTLKYQRWYTNDYNSINAMWCPDLIGSVHDMGKASDVIKKVKSNLGNYALAYPISGTISGKPVDESIIRNPKTRYHPFYDGPDATLGSNYFVKMGKCSAKSVAEDCRGQDRYVFVRNIPKGGGFKEMTGCNIQGLTEGRGLLPGIVEDVGDMLRLKDALGDEDGDSFGSTKCALVRQRVGKNVTDENMRCKVDGNPTPDELHDCLYNSDTKKVKSWWYETRCSPQPEALYPQLKGVDESFRVDPSSPRTTVIATEASGWCALARVLLALLVCGLVVCSVGAVVHHLYARGGGGGGPRAFKKGATTRMART